MAGNDSICRGQLRSASVETEKGSTETVVPNPEVSEAQAVPDAGPQGLGGRLLGGKTLGEERRTITARFVLRVLALVQDASCETVTMAFDRRGEPRDTDQVAADAMDRHVVC